MIAIEIEKNLKPQTWFHGDVDEVTFQSVRLDRACDIDLSRHASHPKNNSPMVQKEGSRGKNGPQREKQRENGPMKISSPIQINLASQPKQWSKQ